jgi:hypothetical protein
MPESALLTGMPLGVGVYHFWKSSGAKRTLCTSRDESWNW